MTLTVRCEKAFTDTTKPVVRYDDILTAGSLMLIDPTHPVLPWPSGVPGNAVQVPNVAINEAKAAISGATDADVKPTVYVPAAFTGTAGKIERTGKGGLHGISPQAGTAVTQSGPSVQFPLRIIRYMLQNPRHSYYVSSWTRFTRGPSGVVEAAAIIISGDFALGSPVELTSAGPRSSTTVWSHRPNTAPPRVGYAVPASVQTATPDRFSIATSDWYNPRGVYPAPLPGDGTDDTNNGTCAAGMIGFGSVLRQSGIKPDGTVVPSAAIGGQSGSGAKNLLPSKILYRVYIEDLTVSGRSYATVDAIDAAQFSAAFNALTGRYGSDTFTDPATLP